MKGWRAVFLAAAVFAFGLSGTAEARYESDSDTGAEALDFIENMRRNEREGRLTEDQVQLASDAAAMRAAARAPKEAGGVPPLAIEGDDMFYDQATGDVYAKGDVRVTSSDARRFISDKARGNLKTQEVRVDDSGRMLQMTPGQPKARLDGYRIVYNYGSRKGRMEDAKGKIGSYNVYGRRIEIYPERVLIYDGYATKCGAQSPDYRISGDLIEIFPNDEMIVYQAKYWLKDRVIYSRDEYRVDISEGAMNDNVFPRVGYSNSDGLWVSQRVEYGIAPRLTAFAHLKYYTRRSFRNVYGLDWRNGGSYATVQYGRFKDGDDNWVKKAPTFRYTYNDKVGDWPFHYTLSFEEGRWSNRGIDSTHTNYGVYLSRDVFTIGRKWFVGAGVGYSVTTESYDHSKVDGFNYDVNLLRPFGKDVIAYAGYHYNKYTSQNALFDYSVDDYARKIDYGISWAFTPRDRVVFGQEFDATAHTVKDIDYYWFHDMHCAQMIVRYRAKRDSWHVSMEFTPW